MHKIEGDEWKMKKVLLRCIECKRHEVVDAFYSDGLACSCLGMFRLMETTSLPVTINAGKKIKQQPLLTIELENETAVPKVFYKGEEVTSKVHISFDWDTDTDVMGGLSYAIEHIDKDKKYPNTNRIECRVKGHACN